MKKSIKTKKKILATAIHLFYKNGYDATPTKLIAENAGVSEATIFKYFTTKSNLLIKALTYFIDHNKPELFDSIEIIIQENKDLSLEKTLKKIILNRKNLFNKYYELISIIISESRNHPEIKNIFEALIIPKIKKYGNRLINYGKKTGQIKPHLNNKTIIRSWIGSIFFLLFNQKLLKEEDDLSFEEEVSQIIEIFFTGIRKEA